MDKTYEIYVITNQVNGMQYVGQTTRGHQKRFESHVKKAEAGNTGELYKAMASDGIHNFGITHVYAFDNAQDLNRAEKKAIVGFDTMYPRGYNRATGGKVNYEPLCELYIIRNLTDGHYYVGYTTAWLETAWRRHIICTNLGYRTPLNSAMAMDGVDSFSIEPLCYFGGRDKFESLRDFVISHEGPGYYPECPYCCPSIF